MKKILIIVLGILMTVISFSKTLEGIGTGTSEAMAKKEALGDLSSQVQVSIKSNFSSVRTLENKESSNKMSSDITTMSETNLLGVDFEVKKKWFRKSYTATATLDDSKVGLYEKKANDLRAVIGSNYTQAQDAKDLDEKKNYITSALQHYKSFNSYKTVAEILGSRSNFIMPVTNEQLVNELEKIEKQIDSDSLYNGVNILYVKSTGKFGGDSKEYFDNYFYAMLARISKDNNNKVAVSNDNDSTVNTLVKVVLNSNHTSIKPAVYYNKNMITPDTYVTNLNMTVELYNKKKVENLLTITVTGEGSDEISETDAYGKAVKNGFEQMREKLEKALIRKR